MSTPESNLRVAHLVIEDLAASEAALRDEVLELKRLVVTYRWMCLATLDQYQWTQKRLQQTQHSVRRLMGMDDEV